MTLSRGEELVSTGADCLGNPLAAVAWLASTAREHGHPLRGGEIILSGALGPVVPVRPGDVFIATISDIGSVSAQFSDLAPSPDAMPGRSTRATSAPRSPRIEAANGPGPNPGSSRTRIPVSGPETLAPLRDNADLTVYLDQALRALAAGFVVEGVASS